MCADGSGPGGSPLTWAPFSQADELLAEAERIQDIVKVSLAASSMLM